MTKVIFILGFSGLAIFVGLCLLPEFSSFQTEQENTRIELKLLSSTDEIMEGDLIFQTSLSQQSQAIQLATHSKYSHCGIIFHESGEFYVIEAVQPVKSTPLDQWIDRGKDDHYVIKRLKNSGEVLTPDVLQRLEDESGKLKGKSYDFTFEWSDEKIYCSELIWKVYQRAVGIELGQLQKLSDFDLSSEPVKTALKERYGAKIPTDEMVISPSSIFESEMLITVKSN